MKKVRSFLIAALCAVLCTACEAKDPENVFEMPPTETRVLTEPTIEAEVEPQPETAPQIGFQEEVTLSVPYQYGNMQKNIPPGNFMDYGDNILFYHLNKERNYFYLYSVDKETLEVSFLCQDATCSHVSAKCPSANKAGNLEQYDGRIFVLSDPVGGKIMELIDDRFEVVADSGISSFWHANGNLYASTMDSALVVFENGSKASRILIEEFTMNRCIVFGQYLYGSDKGGRGISRVDLLAEDPKAEIIVPDAMFITDGTYIYSTDMQSLLLSRRSMDGGESLLLSEDPILAGSLNFDDDYLYFRFLLNHDIYGEGCHDLYRLSKDDPAEPEIIAEIPDVIYQTYTVPGYDYIFIFALELTDEGGEKDVYYAVAKDGSSVEKLELPDF